MTDLHQWVDYISVINAERLNAIRNLVLTNEDNISDNALGVAINASLISDLDDEKLDRNGSQWMTGELNMSTNQIINLSTPTLYHHAVNKSYADSLSITELTNLNDVSNVSYNSGYVLKADGSGYKGNAKLTINELNDHNVSAHNALNIDADKVDGIEGTDLLKKDGTIAMTGDLNLSTNKIYPRSSTEFLYSSISNKLFFERSVSPATDMYIGAKNNTMECFITAGNQGWGILGVWSDPYGLWINLNPFTDEVYPYHDNTYSFGKSSKRWADVYSVDAHFDNFHRSLPFHIKNSSSTEYLLGTGTVNTMYPFNETITITNYVINYDADTNSRIDIELADINGSWHSNSLTESAAGGYQDNKSFAARTVSITDKLQIKLHNVSDINYMNFVLNYK